MAETMNLKYSELEEQRKVDAWNQGYSPGKQVVLTKESGEKVVTRTVSEAHVMCGQAVIWLEGVAGCYSLDSISPAQGV
jgi:hypothetical protein